MIGIVGGGISGLFLLHLLREKGLEAVLLEASPVPGGVMRSRRLQSPNGPVTVDLGPQRMRLTAGIAEIVERLDLTPSMIEARSGISFTMYRRGRLHPAPTSLGEAMTTGLVSWTGKLRALADPMTSPPGPTESVADALRRKLGPEIYERLAGPLLGGLYASDPEEMEARHTLLPALSRTGARRSLLLALLRTRRWDRVPMVSFGQGLAALPEALAERHQECVHLDTPVVSLEKVPGGLALVTPGGSIRVKEAVLTLPAPAAARITESFAPRLAKSLATLRYNPLAVVPLVVPDSHPPPEIGSGYKLTLDEEGATRGVTAHDALFGRPGLYTAFLGGRGREEVVERSDEEIMGIARSDFRTVTGVDTKPLLVHRTWMPAWDRSWRALADLDPPIGLRICSAYMSRPGIPGRLEEARRIVQAATSEDSPPLQSSITPS